MSKETNEKYKIENVIAEIESKDETLKQWRKEYEELKKKEEKERL